MHVRAGDASTTSSTSPQTSKSLLTSRMTPTVSDVAKSGRSKNPMTSPIYNFTVAITSPSVPSTSELGLGRSVSSATDTSTTKHSLTTVMTERTSIYSPLHSFDNRSSPIYLSSPQSSPQTTASGDSSKFVTGYSLSPNRTVTPAYSSREPPVTDRETANNATNETTPMTTTPAISVTSLPLHTGNATLSPGFSDKQLTSMTSQTTPAVTSGRRIIVNESLTSEIPNGTTTAIVIIASHTDNKCTFVYTCNTERRMRIVKKINNIILLQGNWEREARRCHERKVTPTLITVPKGREAC